MLYLTRSHLAYKVHCCPGVVATTDLETAVKGVDVAVMVGGFPRKAGMERKDVMSKNVSIYQSQAAALEKGASKDVKVSDIFGEESGLQRRGQN